MIKNTQNNKMQLEGLGWNVNTNTKLIKIIHSKKSHIEINNKQK